MVLGSINCLKCLCVAGISQKETKIDEDMPREHKKRSPVKCKKGGDLLTSLDLTLVINRTFLRSLLPVLP